VSLRPSWWCSDALSTWNVKYMSCLAGRGDPLQSFATHRRAAESLVQPAGRPGEEQSRSFSNTCAAPFSPSMVDKAHTGDLSQSFLSASGHAWVCRGAAALGLKHKAIFGTRDVLCCCHGLCSCCGLAKKNHPEDNLLTEGRASRGTTCISCIGGNGWVEGPESMAAR